MIYFAGLFDAEGYVSLCPNGAFTIAIEMTNKVIPELFKKEFGGSIYERKRDKRKKTWTWKINSISEQALNFINKIIPYSIIKGNQLLRLRDYLDQPRKDRKSIRAITCSTIKDLKQPIPMIFEQINNTMNNPIEPHFWEWFAGFFDGDGNIVCNEYIDNRNNLKYFSYQISVFNIFPEVICYILDRIPGCLTICARPKNPGYKWSCKRDHVKFVCESILPFLRIKKEQCQLILQFLEFPKKKYSVAIDIETRDRMYFIINQIKHLNSL